MIQADIIQYEQSCHIDEEVFNDTKNELTFDSEYIWIISKKEGEDLCSICFELSQQFIDELKVFVNALDVHYKGANH